MPPTLDLTGATHPKMVMAPPRINLRRAASYNHHADKGPLSSTSSRFSFNHLVFAASPPPSPRLPTLVPPRPRKPSNTPRPSRVFKVVMWLVGGLLVLYMTASTVRRSGAMASFAAFSSLRAAEEERYQKVTQDMLPEFPTPLVFNDQKGNARWAVSIPPKYQSAPLTVREYADMCNKCREVSSRVYQLRQPGKPPLAPGAPDRYFVDVQEAQKIGFLPVPVSAVGNARTSVVTEDGTTTTSDDDRLMKAKPVCSSSLTFVLESADAGLGRTLMHLWTAYSLAQRQGRAFFVDDSRWAYGPYTNIFRAPPAPGCRPPRRHEMLPCPHQARHLIVTSAIAEDFVAASLGLEPESSIERSSSSSDSPAATATPSRAAQLQQKARRKLRFDLAREGYEALFRLNAQDHEYVAGRVEHLLARTQAAAEGDGDGIVVGVHVRRGDRHPVEFQYRDSYVPVNVYAERAQRILDLTYNTSSSSSSSSSALKKKKQKKHRSNGSTSSGSSSSSRDHDGKSRSLVVVASDDPMVYEAEEFAASASTVRAQEQIKLASKTAIQQLGGGNDKSHMHKFVDETFGWEGGFFAAMFWNLGMSSGSAAKTGYQDQLRQQQQSSSSLSSSSQYQHQKSLVMMEEKIPAETLRLRSLVGRAYMMDLAVLARASDVVVCTVSAMGCRLLAVMMGWERAMEMGYWVNIDGDFGWDAESW